MKDRFHVALLRGINVGGNKPVKMDALQKTFSALGFSNVKTLLASGNVLFRAQQSDETGLTLRIKEKLKAQFGIEIGVLLRSIPEIEKLVRLDPFKSICVTPNVRLYVTFLSGKVGSKLKTPFQSPGRDYHILKISGREVFSVLTLTDHTQSTDLMNFLEKEFGRDITTRNWNTVLKIAKALA